MERYDVPEVTTPPIPGDPEYPVAMADYILSELLRGDTKSIHTEGRERDAAGWISGERILAITPEGNFRQVLARFGFYYLGGQVYGGEGTVELRGSGRSKIVTIRLSNEGRTGFWAELTAHPETQNT